MGEFPSQNLLIRELYHGNSLLSREICAPAQETKTGAVENCVENLLKTGLARGEKKGRDIYTFVLYLYLYLFLYLFLAFFLVVNILPASIRSSFAFASVLLLGPKAGCNRRKAAWEKGSGLKAGQKKTRQL